MISVYWNVDSSFFNFNFHFFSLVFHFFHFHFHRFFVMGFGLQAHFFDSSLLHSGCSHGTMCAHLRSNLTPQWRNCFSRNHLAKSTRKCEHLCVNVTLFRTEALTKLMIAFRGRCLWDLSPGGQTEGRNGWNPVEFKQRDRHLQVGFPKIETAEKGIFK